MGATVLACLRRRPEAIFAGAGLALLPWIVILALTQQDRGVAQHIKPLRLTLAGFILLLGLGLLFTAAAAPLAACMLGGAAAGFALSAVWFDLVTRIGLPASRFIFRLGVDTALTGLSTALLALCCLYRHRGMHLRPRLLLVLSLAVLVAEATSIVTNEKLTLPVDNVGVAWIGLDVCEFIGLVTVAIATKKHWAFVAFAGPATAALLLSDAAINIITAGGLLSLLAAIAMAVLEVGLAVLAIAAAARTARHLTSQARAPVKGDAAPRESDVHDGDAGPVVKVEQLASAVHREPFLAGGSGSLPTRPVRRTNGN